MSNQARAHPRRWTRWTRIQAVEARRIYFSRATDADLDALIAWTRMIPPPE
jgi:hypothetical protein